MRNCTIRVAKTKALISFAKFSHDAANLGSTRNIQDSCKAMDFSKHYDVY